MAIAGGQSSWLDSLKDLTGLKGGKDNYDAMADILNEWQDEGKDLYDKSGDALKPVQYGHYSTPEEVDPTLLNPSDYGISDLGGVDYDQLSPDLYEAMMQGDSAYGDISLDPAYKQKQMDVLSALDDISGSGGMNTQDRASYEDIMRSVEAEDRGRRGAIQQNMGMNGMRDSGMDLLAQLDSSQAASERASQASLGIEGQAMQRKLDALLNSGNLAGSMQQADYSKQADKARANDIINSFNTANTNSSRINNSNTTNAMNTANAANKYNAGIANRTYSNDVNKYNANMASNVGQYNANAKTGANQTNVGARNNISNANVDINNKQIDQNQIKNPQANFNNQVAAYGAGSSQGTAAANAAYKMGQQQDNARDDNINTFLAWASGKASKK